MRSAERRVDEVADVGVPFVHRKSIAVLGGSAQRVDVADVELGIDALAEQVHRQRDQIDVAGPLAVAEQAALDAVGPGEHPEFGRGDRAAPVVVRMQRQHHGVAVADRAEEPFDRVGVHIGRVHLDGRWVVHDQWAVRGRLDDLGHRVADVDRELDLGAGVALRGVLVADVGSGNRLFELAAIPRRIDGDVDDPVAIETEDHAALQHRGRVVEVDDRAPRPGDRFEGAVDQLGSTLHEHLDRDVVGNQIVLDQLPDEVEVGLGCRREPDLDFLEAHRHERVEEPPLARRVHGVDQRLVAVAKIDRAPQRCRGEVVVGPGAVRQLERRERLVLLERHLLGLDRWWGHVGSQCCGYGWLGYRRSKTKEAPGPWAQELRRGPGRVLAYVSRSIEVVVIAVGRYHGDRGVQLSSARADGANAVGPVAPARPAAWRSASWLACQCSNARTSSGRL